MLALGIVIAYLLVDFVLGRRVFVNTLGDNKRIRDSSYTFTYWSPEFTAAIWWSITTIFAWPLVCPVRLVFSPTPHEKTVKRQAELEKLDEKMRSLEQEFGLKFNPERLGQ